MSGTLRRIRQSDLPRPYPDLEIALSKIEARTQARVRDGEYDALIFYILQSKSFTPAPPIEPALSSQFPQAVEARFRSYIKAQPGPDPRLFYFKSRLQNDLATLQREYHRVVEFLNAKEFEAASIQKLYRGRGLSTDSSIEANFAVWSALAVAKPTTPAIDRVLVIGPGAELAPRTGLNDDLPPQSHQPFAVVDALLQHGLAARPEIHCIDVNPRVVETVLQTASLHLVPAQQDPEYLAYFRQLGRHIGTRIGNQVTIRAEIRRNVTAQQANIVTSRLDPSPAFDAAIATNILLYLDPLELMLALSNIASMLKHGGLFISNELNPQSEAAARAAGLTPLQGRTIKIGDSRNGSPLYDAIVIYRKEPSK